MREDNEASWAGIGRRLCETRKSLGLSQREMADNMGVVFRSYQNYEKGLRGVPIDAIMKLTQWLGEADASWIVLGKRSVRMPEDLDTLKRISAQLDERVRLRAQSNPSEKRAKLMARWYESFLDGRELSECDIDALIDMAA